MPRYISTAPAVKERLVSPWFSAGLLLGTLAVFVFFFPKTNLNRLLAQEGQVTAATLAYLQLMVQASPKDPDLHILLARRALQAGNYALAERALMPWSEDRPTQTPLAIERLKLAILRTWLLATRLHSAARFTVATRYRKVVIAIAPRLPVDDLIEQAKLNLAMGLYQTAATLSHEALSRTDNPKEALRAFQLGVRSLLASGKPAPALAFAEAALGSIRPSAALWRDMFLLAMQAGESRHAADYAQRWFARAPSPADRRRAFDAVIEARLAGGQPLAALTAARRLLPNIPHDAALWRRMTRLALAANQPMQAAHYARLLMGMQAATP
ncbi:MAG TPA: tetratricopeptide repeat protein [Chromatiales bacterium]|nr:tetratricopeptide repeat protein [Chromatiales bacterium]